MQVMASPLSQIGLDQLEGRHFSFYPAILNIEHNEWTLVRQTWSEVLVSNAGTDLEMWIPSGYIGAISSSDSPVLIVGLAQELEWKAGKVWPHRKQMLEMPRPAGARRSSGLSAVPAPPRRGGSGPGTEPRIGRFVAGALGFGLIACLLTILFAFDALRNPWHMLFPADTSTADQRYLSLTASDNYSDIVLKTDPPASQQWLTGVEASIQFEILYYARRSYALVLMGASRDEARYIGALHLPSRKILDTVRLSDGGTTASMLKNLPEF